MQHVGAIEGPLNLSGREGKAYFGRCSCGKYSTGPVSYPGQAEARLTEHAKAKEVTGK